MSLRDFNHPYVQRAAEIVMALGIVALCQPWNLFLHRYGLTIVLVGLVGFMVTGWIGPMPDPQEVDAHERPGQ